MYLFDNRVKLISDVVWKSTDIKWQVAANNGANRSSFYCSHCGHPLSWYYAESSKYIIKCNNCQIFTISSARSPYQALCNSTKLFVNKDVKKNAFASEMSIVEEIKEDISVYKKLKSTERKKIRGTLTRAIKERERELEALKQVKLECCEFDSMPKRRRTRKSTIADTSILE